MDTVNLNGTEYPVVFTYSVIKRYCVKRGIELHEFDNLFTDFFQTDEAGNERPVTLGTLTDMMLFWHTAFQRGCEIAKVPFDLTEDDLLDAITPEISGQLFRLFIESAQSKKNINQEVV